MDEALEHGNISQITEFLYVGSKIRAEDWDRVEAIGPDLVISMVGGRVYTKLEFHESIEFLMLRSFDTFLTPIPMRKLLQGVRIALPVIDRGGKVLVYCMKGMRRSVTMAAAILIARGHTAQEAVALIKQRREAADPSRFYVKRRIRRFEAVWKRREASGDVQ